jgi:hypothetical protein
MRPRHRGSYPRRSTGSECHSAGPIGTATRTIKEVVRPGMHSVSMTLAIAGPISGPLAALLAVWLTYRLTGRQTGCEVATVAHAAAATDLYSPLRDLQSLVRRHGRVTVTPAEVAHAFRCFYDADDRHRHQLPEGWAHLRRSIRAATGTALGGIAFVDLDPTTESLELAEPDARWGDYADDYIDYVVDRVMRWGGPTRLKDDGLEAFDPWLVRTGRRQPVGHMAN